MQAMGNGDTTTLGELRAHNSQHVVESIAEVRWPRPILQLCSSEGLVRSLPAVAG